MSDEQMDEADRRRLGQLRADARSDELLNDLLALEGGAEENWQFASQVARRAHDQLRHLRARVEVLEAIADMPEDDDDPFDGRHSGAGGAR